MLNLMEVSIPMYLHILPSNGPLFNDFSLFSSELALGETTPISFFLMGDVLAAYSPL